MATVVQSSADILEHAGTDSTAPPIDQVTITESRIESREKDATDTLTSHVLLWSFVTAVVLAIAGFVVVAVYLFLYLNHAFTAFSPETMDQLSKMDYGSMQSIIVARSGLWKFILQSCGVIAGVAFGFLGFALFLLGAKGDMDASFDDSQHKVQLSRMAPGSFVILIAVILIGICCYQRVDVKLPSKEVDSTLAPQNSSPANSDTNSAPIPDQSNLPPATLIPPSGIIAAPPAKAAPTSSRH
jgi:hypothetical protein